jgi:hypothetical protein
LGTLADGAGDALNLDVVNENISRFDPPVLP